MCQNICILEVQWLTVYHVQCQRSFHPLKCSVGRSDSLCLEKSHADLYFL